MENKTPGHYEKLLNMPVCPVCNGAEWITDADKKMVRCKCFEQRKAVAAKQRARRAEGIVEFLDAIATTEIITADGGDRDVNPDGFGFSGEMMKLIEAIAQDENDVWNTAARCALAGPASQNLRAVHWREAFDMAIGCIEFGSTNKNGGPEFLDALRKYADLMIQELEPAADTETKESTDEGQDRERAGDGR
jgi:hypothetical protein